MSDRTEGHSPEYARISFRPTGGNHWTVERPSDPDAVSFVRADIADRDRRQRDMLLKAAKGVLDEFIGANEPALNALGEAVDECEKEPE